MNHVTLEQIVQKISKFISQKCDWKHGVALVSFVIFLNSLFSLITLISLGVFLTMSVIIVTEIAIRIQKKGIINYFPDSL